VSAGTELFKVEKIPALTREELQDLANNAARKLSIREAARAAVPYYSIPAIEEPAGSRTPVSVPASSLRLDGTEEAEAADNKEDALDTLIKRAGIEANHFGTMVHAFLEAHFSGGNSPGKLFIPPDILARLDEKQYEKILEETKKTADRFINSELGAFAENALWIEPEFPFISVARINGRPLRITGQIDLLFETEGTIHIVDFKTDKVENPRRHLGQLAVYRRAVSDIYTDKAVQAWLFYLRGGKALSVTESLDAISIENLAANYLEAYFDSTT
jgi:ATP-dependent exoDNAse (exonuclease V) beta subunit